MDAKMSLPSERKSLTHHFEVGGVDGYVTVGFGEHGNIREVWLIVSGGGHQLRASMDAVSTAVSMGLHHGIPIEEYIEKFRWQRFEPSGPTGDAEIPMATSILDYVFRWIERRFIGG